MLERKVRKKMSKLLKQYQELKKKDSNKIYIFQVGIFYNLLNEDAQLVSNKIVLKLTNLSPEIVKCGFPITKLEKYTHLFESLDLKYELVTNQAPLNQGSYSSIIKNIQNIDLENTTCKEAFDILYNIQQKLKNIQ